MQHTDAISGRTNLKVILALDNDDDVDELLVILLLGKVYFLLASRPCQLSALCRIRNKETLALKSNAQDAK